MIYENFIRQGWQCPICQTVYSPDTPVCFYCNPNLVKTKTTTTFGGYNSLDWLKHDSITEVTDNDL